MARKKAFGRGLVWTLPGAAVLVLLIVVWPGHRVSASAARPAPAAPAQSATGQAPQGQPPAGPGDRPDGHGRRGRDFGPGGPGSGPGYWWKNPSIVSEVGLTDQQVSQIDRLYETRSKQMAAYATEYKKQSDTLDQMFRERTVEPTEIELQASKMWSMRVEIEKTRLVMLYRIDRVLTVDQYKKLQAIFERLMQSHTAGRGGN